MDSVALLVAVVIIFGTLYLIGKGGVALLSGNEPDVRSITSFDIGRIKSTSGIFRITKTWAMKGKRNS